MNFYKEFWDHHRYEEVYPYEFHFVGSYWKRVTNATWHSDIAAFDFNRIKRLREGKA